MTTEMSPLSLNSKPLSNASIGEPFNLSGGLQELLLYIACLSMMKSLTSSGSPQEESTASPLASASKAR